MHLSNGIDIIEIDRIEKAITANPHFKERVFTPNEIAYCEGKNRQKYASYAGIYAAKEAFVKALGTGFRQGAWHDLEVGHTEEGAPTMLLQGGFLAIFKERNFTTISLSISHSREYAVSEVLLL